MLESVAFSVLFIGPDRRRNCKRYPHPSTARANPLLEGAQFQRLGVPTGLRRGQRVVVLLQPEVEIPVWVQLGNRLTKKCLQLEQELVNLRQLLACIGEEVIDLQRRMVLPHIDR